MILTEIGVSYLIPSFNHARFIQQCLESVKSEMKLEDEIIVIDDGSSDDSSKKVLQWIKDNPNVKCNLISQKNVGVCATLNRLIMLANGNYLRIVASDDMIILGSTQNLLTELNSSVSFKLAIFGDAITVNQDGNQINSSNLSFLGKDIELYKKDVLAAIISQWGIAGPSLLLRKNFEQYVGHYDESLLIEDWNMYLRLAGLNQIMFYSRAPVAYYRVHSTNSSITKNVAKRINNLKSQLSGGLKNMAILHSPYHYLLRSEIHFLTAKVCYLEKAPVRVISEMILFLLNKVKYNVVKIFFS